MVIESIIRHLLSDDESLSAYRYGQQVSFDDIKRRLFLLERRCNNSIPDHYYWPLREKSFKGIDSLDKIFTIGLPRIAEQFLEMRDNKVYVKHGMQNKWQELITLIPPLLLIASLLHKQQILIADHGKELHEYFYNYIFPNCRYTAIPHPYIPQIEKFIKEQNGLHDLHMHLNGSIETDSAWQDFLQQPNKIYEELCRSYEDKEMVREHLTQEAHLISPLFFKELLHTARRIRAFLFNFLYEIHTPPPETWDQVIDTILLSQQYDTYKHPFGDLFFGKIIDDHQMAVECMMYVLLLRDLSKNPRTSIANLFHFYLLILGLSNRLLVQQTYQFGFEQFHKHTLNNLRRTSESEYRKRFLQLQGNDLRNISYLEGRFSPQLSLSENERIIHDIYEGWEHLIQKRCPEQIISEKPELKLIAHFIKKKDLDPDPFVRHKSLRCEVWERASVLALMKENGSRHVENITGIDAAASEFDAPPEVFAPSFRLLRRKGFRNFTYHAGEDFYHIIGGLRAIYEAIDFLDMECGDRIGHASAAGVSPELWTRNVGETILIKQGEYLDDLIFTYHLIVDEKIKSLEPRLPYLAMIIQDICHDVYREHYSVIDLIAAWKLRKYCPLLSLSDDDSAVKYYSVYNREEYYLINDNMNISDNNIKEIVSRYHCHSLFKKSYDKIIEVGIFNSFDAENIEKLQLAILNYMHRKEIVIETLPTSNVRIGHHHNFDTYHLYNWISWQQTGKTIPPIVVGTDDTGIFATNILNEYANIYCHLTTCRNLSHIDTMQIIRQLDDNAKIYRFE